MKTTVERESPTRLRLLIEVEPDELAPHYERTMKRLAGEVNIPGFRKGKVPRSVLETRVGTDTIKEEFLRDALPALYLQAASAEDVRPITLPELDVTSYERGEQLSFTATIEVRPEITLPEYKGIEVDRPTTEPTDEEINEQLERLRDRFGTLEPIGRNATKGDYVTIDLQGYQHDQKIDQASAQDLVYEVGSASIVPELDTELEGKRAGDILKFNSVLPQQFGDLAGKEVSFSVIVKDVQAKKLPALDDDFAKTASEFDTLDELKAEIVKRLDTVKGLQADSEMRSRILEDLVDRTDLPLPESIVDAEVAGRVNRLGRELEQAGMTLDQYLEATNMSREEILKVYREAAEKAVSADLVLEAVAKAEGIEVADEEIQQEIKGLAEAMDVEVERLDKDLRESDRVDVLAGDILRRKALDFLVEHAEVTQNKQE